MKSISLKFEQDVIFTLNSNAPTPIPPAAPDPAKPMKCSLPILLANSDAPTCAKKWFIFNFITVTVTKYSILVVY